MRKLKNEELGRLSPDEYKVSNKLPVVVVLDNVRSMNNIGSAFRTADAFRIEKIILTGISATPPHREIHKTALGATKTVDWEYVPETLVAIHQLKKEGYQVLAVEQTTDSISLEQMTPLKGKSYGLVFGNEINGVQEAVVQEADASLEIPQFGSKHSLNIAVSIGVVLWSFSKALRP